MLFCKKDTFPIGTESVWVSAWRAKGGKYKDVAGFCMSAKLDEIKKHGYILTPGRYVGTEVQEEDDGLLKKR